MEEMSLRELIEIILKGKWLIIGFTIFCMVVSGVASFFIIDPVYEAQSMLMISPITTTESGNKEGNDFLGLVGSLSRYPQMTVDTYKEQVKAPEILDYIRKEMRLDNYPLKAIGDKITVEAIKNTNLITISVRDTDPQKAATMANLLSDRFTDFVSETNRKQAENSADFIKEQQEKEKENLDKALKELKDFVSQPRGPEELRRELNSKLEQLTEYKTMLSQIKIEENSISKSLEHGKELLKDIPEKLVLNKSLLDDEFLEAIVREKTNLNAAELSGLKLSTEEINEIYVEAAKKVNELEVELSRLTAQRQNMEQEISLRQEEIKALQAELAEKQQKYDILNHNVELVRQTYDAYQQKYKEALIKQSAEIGKSSIIVVSRAIPPLKPVEPNKMMNMAVAAVLGIMISIFAVFAREYWNKGSKVQSGGSPSAM